MLSMFAHGGNRVGPGVITLRPNFTTREALVWAQQLLTKYMRQHEIRSRVRGQGHAVCLRRSAFFGLMVHVGGYGYERSRVQ
jgi:hypothetical protein